MDKRLGIKHIVLAVFHKSMLDKDSFNLALAINKRMEKTFKVSPMIIPGENTPPDVPRVIFKSENGITLTVSKISTNLQIDVPEGEKSPQDTMYGFLETGDEVISLVSKDFGCEISRVGVVLVGNIALDITGAEFIKQNYLNGYDEPLFGSEVHWLTHPIIVDEKINRWVRIKSDTDLNGAVNEFIEIIIDSNIIHEPERTVTGDYARDYLKACINDMHDNFNAITKIS